MPRNLKGGNKAKKGANKNVQSKKGKDDTPLPDESLKQYIGQVISVYGDCRYNSKIINKDTISLKELMIHLPGSLKRKSRISVGSIVMVSHRGFENKGDICYLYSSDDKEFLISKGYIFDKNIKNDDDDDDDDDNNDGFVFENTSKPEIIEESEFDILIDGL
jgi:translation initiation factor IF-1